MIQDTLSKVVYTADGLQRQWYIPFQFNDKEDLHIYLTEDGVRVEEIVQNFEIIENGEIKKIDNPDVEVIPAGNYVVYPTEESGLAPLEAGKQILILRETPNTQLEDSSQIYFKSNDVERALDKLTMQVQELTRDSYRAVKVSHFDTTSPEDFTEALFEAGAKAEEAAARAATSESNAALSEQNAASSASSASYSATTAATASANALAAADLARSRANDSLRNAERAEIAAADSNMHASNSAESANMAATLLQEVSNSIYNKAQVDEKISGLQAEIDTVEASIPDVKEEFNQGLSELQTQIYAQSSVVAGKQDKLVAGSNITINGNVISATGGGGGGGNAGSADIAKAIENQNKVADTVDPIYNWLGTQQEYEEQNIALEHPDWVCFITDDMGEQGGGTGGSSEAKWGAITGDINAQTDLTNLINAKTATIAEKQDKLTAGEGITIEGNVISATGGGGGGSAELPDNVYTQDNLVAGDNIEIKEVVNPNVIDDNTLLCWHFDGDTKDVVNGEDFTLYPGYGTLNTTYYKFGTASAPDYVQNGLYITLKEPLTDKDNFTLDYWIYGHGADTDTLSFTTRLAGGISATNGTSIYLRAFGNDQNLLDISDANGNYVGSLAKSNSISSKEWSHWAYTYNKDTREFSVYANGVKQGAYAFPSGNPFNIEIIYPVDTNYNQFAIDEFRLTKSLAWEKDFTPPTEPYVKSDAPAKKAISAIIPPVELPSDVYRQSNLLGGKDIEIVPEPVEGGIDEYTLSCFHLDESTEDVVTGYVPPNVTIDKTLHKFGTGSTMWVNTTSFPWSLNSYDSFSFDFWIYRKSDRSAALGLGIFRGSPSCHIYISSGNNPIQFSVHGLIKDTGVYIDNNTWSHIYVYYNADDRSYHLFLNGKEIYSEVNTTDFSNLRRFESDGFTTSRFDEIRISKCIRWTEDFEPPTQPYRKAEPTGNYLINFTGQSVKNIGEVYYSQSSLASDNAGALPLFTGETIASANTIYPDFYAWVEKHNELQTTAEEYETALTTYGECPKYVVSNGSLRLPKLANYVKMANTSEGITQSEAGLPNITGGVRVGGYKQDSTSSYSDGALSYSGMGSTTGDFYGNTGNGFSHVDVSLNASNSNPIYGNSATVTPAHTTLYPWVFAFNASVATSTAQAAEFQEGLSGKADTNLGNIPTNYDYVVESYNDGTNWYRVYKSGWIEQGGKYDNGTAARTILLDVTFLKPFSNANYFYNLHSIREGSGNRVGSFGSALAQSTSISSIFYGASESDLARYLVWYACGQGAEL